MKNFLAFSIIATATAAIFAGCASDDDYAIGAASSEASGRSYLQSGNEGGADADLDNVPPPATPAPFTRPLQP
jgi:hypothetical protein